MCSLQTQETAALPHRKAHFIHTSTLLAVVPLTYALDGSNVFTHIAEGSLG